MASFSLTDWTGEPSEDDLEELVKRYRAGTYIKAREPRNRGFPSTQISDLSFLFEIDSRVDLATLDVIEKK